LKPKVLLIGASTGGPLLIKELLLSLTSLNYTIVIAQHMKEEVLPFYIDDLKGSVKFCVKSTPITSTFMGGDIIVCSKSTTVQKECNKFKFVTDTANQIYTPDINKLFNSFLPYANELDISIIILSGIGSDGVNGSKNLKQYSSKIIAQDEKDCAVYGMPKAMVEMGIVDEIRTIDEIKNYMREL